MQRPQAGVIYIAAYIVFCSVSVFFAIYIGGGGGGGSEICVLHCYNTMCECLCREGVNM